MVCPDCGSDHCAKWLEVIDALREVREIGKLRLCKTKTPEPHLEGEFPMTCYQCHLVVDS